MQIFWTIFMSFLSMRIDKIHYTYYDGFGKAWLVIDLISDCQLVDFTLKDSYLVKFWFQT